ncbi:MULTISPECIES: MDR family MFS transporter [Sporosarcina]|uniref:MDR family MFS transporter n=1 Tax=Sporosarcina TaxID=1569 RepID=UPI00058E9D16|nr:MULTISPECIES: MDR family MFS transporter [Sporosarcina]WJY27200.1 MDR family MFS transporter [Sporosarcina sp. 0.2-SM1T-5]
MANPQTMNASETFDFKKNIPLLAVLLSGAFITILNQTLLATALPPIMHDLNVKESTVQWLQSAFMLVNGIMIPITAFLIGKFTTRRLFLFALGVFAAGTAVAAVSPNFTILLLGRVLQGTGAGIMMPLLQTVMFLLFPREQRGKAMGMFGLVIAFAPAIGPTLSGYLVDHYPWRSVFYVVLPIVLIIITAAYFLLKNVTELTNPRVDYLSIVLSTFGFGGILYGFSVAGNVGWLTPNTIISLAVGAAALAWFINRQLKLEEPILEFRVFRYGVFALATSLGMIVFASMIATTVILPLFMQNLLGFNALHSGLMLLPGAIVTGIMNPVTGSLFDKYGAKWLLRIGFAILTVTTFMFSTLSEDTTFLYLAVLNAVRMVGIATVMMPSTTLGLNQLPNHLIPHGTAMNNTFRQIAGAIGTAVLVTVTITAANGNSVAGHIHGVNVAFLIAGCVAAAGLLLSFLIRDSRAKDRSVNA